MTKRCTLKDIARVTGLTVNSVSHALRDMADISEETKRKVRKVAQEMGYIPNFSAASLRSGRSKTIGIVYDNLLNPYYSIMIHYLNYSLSRYGYGFLTFVETHGSRMSVATVNDIMARSVDGIITFIEPEDTATAQLSALRVPILVIGRHMKYDFMDYIYTDDKAGGTIATEHLIALGYRKIAYMADTMEISCAQERAEGYRQTMARSGLAPHLYVDQVSYVELTERALRDGCDAIICFNDFMALEVLYALEARGRSDVAVIGYDNIQNELKIPHQLTTIGYDKAQIADVAVEVLMHKIDSAVATRTFVKVHDVTLVAGSTAHTTQQ